MTWAFTHHLGTLVRQSDPPILYLFLTYPVETLTSAGRTEDLRRTEGPASEEETVRTLTGMADQDGPYRQALGERAAALHPRLESYFSPLPPGRVGRGHGVLTRIGSRRPLRVLMRPFQARGALYAGWDEDVPFEVTNRGQDGAVVAERRFHLPGGDWVMRDRVTLAGEGAVEDLIGAPPALSAVFEVEVERGALVLRSRSTTVRLGRLRLRIPRLVAPRIHLEERFVDELERQQVSLSVDLPVLGRIYEYRGTFVHHIEEEP